MLTAAHREREASTSGHACLRRGAGGNDVRLLQKALATRGFDPGDVDGQFGAATEAAVLAFQCSEGLLADAMVGPRTSAALGLREGGTLPSATSGVSVEIASRLLPSAPLDQLRANLPLLLAALDKRGVGDRTMVLLALATVRAEGDTLLPPIEVTSRLNTSPGGRSFDRYDHRKDLGNLGAPDGASFVGRGYVQLRGRAAYRRYGPRLWIPCDLEQSPELACTTEVAADLLALFIVDREAELRRALFEGCLPTARRLINGGSHRVDQFANALQTGDRVLPDPHPSDA